MIERLAVTIDTARPNVDTMNFVGGLMMGRSFRQMLSIFEVPDSTHVPAMKAGVVDGLANTRRLTEEEMERYRAIHYQRVAARALMELNRPLDSLRALFDSNAVAAQAHLETFRARPGVISLADGVLHKVLKRGTAGLRDAVRGPSYA